MVRCCVWWWCLCVWWVVFFVERDDMVQKFAAATPHPAFGHTVLPGRLNAGSLGLQARSFQKRNYFGVELRVAIQNDLPVRGSFRECLP